MVHLWLTLSDVCNEATKKKNSKHYNQRITLQFRFIKTIKGPGTSFQSLQ